MFNLFILVIDCLGLDRYEGEQKTAITPNLDTLRSRSLYFANSHAVGSNTNSVMGACFTGLYPSRNGIRSFFDRQLPGEIPTLASLLADCGYATAATVTDALAKATDLLRGVQLIERRDKNKETIYNGYGESVRQQIVDFKASQQPWFYFVHTAELHQPRQCQPHFAQPRYGETFYDRSLSCVDHYLAPILSEIDFDNTLVVVMGDHGDNLLWEPATYWMSFLCSALRSDVRRLPGLSQLRDYYFAKGLYSTSKQWLRSNFLFHHDYHIYRFLSSSPVFISVPDSTPRRIEAPISSVDLLPTLLDCQGLPALENCDGVSLRRLMDGRTLALPPRALYQEVVTSFVLRKRDLLKHQEPLLEAVIDYPWKLVVCPLDAAVCQELYNLEQDPGEYSNLYSQYSGTELVNSLKIRLEDLHKQSNHKELV
jgi:arylsulfatase A-like enzyme